MSEFRARQNGLFFENVLTPQERNEAEYRERVRDLEKTVQILETRIQLLEGQIEYLIGIKEVNNG